MRIFTKQGICDPHIRIFNGKAYLYSTHDNEPGRRSFRMDDWQIFSSDDLLNWEKEYVLRPEDTFLGKCDKCYATDAVERNGKYYLYFSQEQNCTGVAVSENGPGGPFIDVLHEPLLPNGIANTASYDPAVFIDDDEERTPYIMWGYTCYGKQYHIARLNGDMISLAEEPRPVEIVNSWFKDAPWLWKHNGLYYLLTHSALYATSENIYGPYEFRGRICDATVDHPCIFDYNNQTYMAYGVPEESENPNGDAFFRTTKIVYAHYKENGDITCDEFIQNAGVGHYDASWKEIKGEWFFAASEGIVKKDIGNGFVLRGIKNNSYLYFPNVSGMRQNAKMYIFASSTVGSSYTIEVHEDSPYGKVLGCCHVKGLINPDWFSHEIDEYDRISCELKNSFGTHNLCFVFKGDGDGDLLFDSFCFEQIKP